MKQKFYSLTKILQKKAKYNVIIGERSNGKTYAVLKYGLENFIKSGKQMAIVRRWQDDFVGKRGQAMFQALCANGEVERLTNGEWTYIYYYSGRWFLAKNDEHMKRTICETPLAYGFSISSMEHDKSTSYPDITTIMFDEFLTRTAYLPDEFVLFMNVCSTIIRQRNDVTIFMLGNTVNQYSIYFKEMGLKHIQQMKQGTIDLYHYGDSNLTVAVEYCSPINKEGKESDSYFAFDNPKLSMITGGSWELDIYPHCPCKWRPKDIAFIYFIEFDDQLLQCEVIVTQEATFTYIHRKTTELKEPDKDIIFKPDIDHRPNYRRRITAPTDKVGKKIYEYYLKEKVFYQDNEVGELVRNYLLFCKK